MDDTQYNDDKEALSPATPVEEKTDSSLPRRRTPWQTLDGRVICMVSRKGGVGKTTSTVNLGAALALSGHTVLIVGVDPQCGVCRSLGVEPSELTTGLSEIFSDHRALKDLVHPSPLRDLFFVSPRIDTLDDEEYFLDQLDCQTDEFVRQIDQARILYDTILIDCPPNLGPATRAALLASDSFLVPIQAEELCRNTVEPLLDFVETFRNRNFPPLMNSESGIQVLPNESATLDARPLSLEGMFLTMTSTRTRMGRHVSARVNEDFGAVLFSTNIPRTTRLSEMALKGKPTVIHDRRSAGSRAYFDLADEIVHRYCQEKDTNDSKREDLAESISVSESDPVSMTAQNESNFEEIVNSESSISRTTESLRIVPEPGAGGGLDRFLAELGGSREVSSKISSFEEPAAPEMVSLDDLLAEEESGENNGDDWTDDGWPSRRQPH